MISDIPCTRRRFRRRNVRYLAVALGLLLGLVPLAWPQATPPQGAHWAGSDTCGDCHQQVTAQFRQSVHARLAEFEYAGEGRGCESCHGPASKHLESYDPADIWSFRESGAKMVEDACADCHAQHIGHAWLQSEHRLSGVTCNQCHKIHQSRRPLPVEPGFVELQRASLLDRVAPPPPASLLKPESLLCADCHRQVAARMMLPSRHPVAEGKMRCSSCHAVHGSEVGTLKALERPNELCVECHTSKQGPFVFDHEPVAEDCSTCHNPHGSIANNLLKQNEPFLCLQCHEAHFHIGREGLSTPNAVATGASDNPFGASGFRIAFGTKCTQCHQYVHGTDLPSQTVPGRGRGLIR